MSNYINAAIVKQAWVERAKLIGCACTEMNPTFCDRAESHWATHPNTDPIKVRTKDCVCDCHKPGCEQ